LFFLGIIKKIIYITQIIRHNPRSNPILFLEGLLRPHALLNGRISRKNPLVLAILTSAIPEWMPLKVVLSATGKKTR